MQSKKGLIDLKIYRKNIYIVVLWSVTERESTWKRGRDLTIDFSMFVDDWDFNRSFQLIGI